MAIDVSRRRSPHLHRINTGTDPRRSTAAATLHCDGRGTELFVSRVLIVEDDTVIANAMATHLRREGMEVEWADQGDRAIKKLRFERPDVAIIDLMLPGMDGWTIIKTLRSDGMEIPVI